jgi:xanthine dehydrogenase YagR molybdenum-binding subunit
LKQCLEEGAKAFGWEEARTKAAEINKSGYIRRGVGMASGLWVAGGGGPPSTVIVKLFSDGSANLNMGASDIGTGTKTIMAMVISEELGVPLKKIQIEHADTGTTQYATPSGGSKTVPTEAPAVRAAALEVKRQLLELASSELKMEATDLTIKNGEVISKNDPSKRVKITVLSELKRRGVLLGVGYRGPNPQNKVVNPFVAQFCELEVNTKTGEVKLLRFLSSNDSGRVMNPLTFDNMVFGGITWGIGFGMTAVRILDKKQTGKMVNRNWHDYKLPTAMDVPKEIQSLPIDVPDNEANSTGAKGLGEPVAIPTAAAIANAVDHATGIRITTTPIGPGKLSQLLAEGRKEG